mmetsp:Transcript_3328/g.7160  ORF Transcript_3328/g.7160 Transcript_3328/m.7160 type:complete len:144 (-) Transcript_3328:172-603(-)
MISLGGVAAMQETSTELRAHARHGVRRPLPSPEPLPPTRQHVAAQQLAELQGAGLHAAGGQHGAGLQGGAGRQKAGQLLLRTAENASTASSIFLEPFSEADIEMLSKWGKASQSAKAKEFVAKTFRKLSILGDSSIRPSYVKL